MSLYPTPRGMARAIRRRNAAPSLGFMPFVPDEDDDAEAHQRYRDLRDEGHGHYAAQLMAGLADPHESD